MTAPRNGRRPATVFSTIKGRRKTTNMYRDPRVNLLVQALPVLGPDYATISGSVELTDDPDGCVPPTDVRHPHGEPLLLRSRARNG